MNFCSNPADVLAGLDQLVSIALARGQTLVLVIEDTDEWLSVPRGQSLDGVSDRFFFQVAAGLARDLEFHVVIAAHTTCTLLSGYGAVRAHLGDEISILVLERPSAAIDEIPPATHRCQHAARRESR